MTPKQKVLFQRMVIVFLIVLVITVAYCNETPYVEVDNSSTQECISAPIEVVVEEPQESVEEVVEVLPEIVIEEVPNEAYKGVLVPSNLTAEQLEKGLLYDLKEYAEVFIQAEKETGISAVFLSSVAAFESGWARSEVSVTKNNLFGWTASKGYKTFDSKEESILFVAQRIKELYLTEGGTYFNGYEVSDINVRYNGSQHWEDNVEAIMRQIQARIDKEG